MATDRTIIKNIQAAQYSVAGSANIAGTTVNGNAETARIHQRAVRIPITDAATAGTAAAETTVMSMPVAGRIIAVYASAPVAVALNAGNFATLTLAKRTAGGGATTQAALSTAALSLVAFAQAAFTLTAAAVDFAAGDDLTIVLAKSGTGVAISAATAPLTVTVIYEEI